MRLIFGWFLEGLTTYAIAKELTRRGILTVTGQSKWNQATINSFLRNEVRQDDTNLENIHTRLPNQEAVKNTGQVPSYFVEQSHPAIIAPETFEMVQAEVARRKQEGGRYSGVSVFSGKIKCGECGGFFGAKVWHSTDKYRRTSYNGLVERYEKAKARFDEVTETIAERSAKGERLRCEASVASC